MPTPDFLTVPQDVQSLLASSEGSAVQAEALEAAAVKAGTAVAEGLIRATSGKRNFAPRPRWGQLWATDLGKPCLRQTYYKVSGTTPDPAPVASDEAVGPNGRFLLGDVYEAATIYLVRAAGHHVGNEGERISYVTGAWEVSGRRDCTIDGWSVDVKSASQFAYSKYVREGVTDENDTFGYRAQPDFYQSAGGNDGVKGSALLFVEKGSLDLHANPLSSGAGLRSHGAVNSLVEAMEKGHFREGGAGPGTGDAAVPRVARPVVMHPAKGPIPLVHKACQFCEYKERCLVGSKIAGTEIGKKKVTYFKEEPTGGY